MVFQYFSVGCTPPRFPNKHFRCYRSVWCMCLTVRWRERFHSRLGRRFCFYSRLRKHSCLLYRLDTDLYELALWMLSFISFVHADRTDCYETQDSHYYSHERYWKHYLDFVVIYRNQYLELSQITDAVMV